MFIANITGINDKNIIFHLDMDTEMTRSFTLTYTFLHLALRSSGPLWNNGQQVSPAHTVGCHCLFLTPADSSCL